MKKRYLSIALILGLIAALCLSSASGDVDYNATYETAIKLASNDLTNLTGLQDSISMLEQTGAYAYSKSYLMYFQALLELQKDDDLYTANLRLSNCSRQEGFVTDLQERGLPSCEELLKYIEARKLESEGKDREAYAAFVDLTVLDSPDRAFELSLILPPDALTVQGPASANDALPDATDVAQDPVATPEPAVTDVVDTTNTPVAMPTVPVLSEAYPGSSAHLRNSKDESFRVYSYAGPGKDFVAAGGYKPYKQKSITVYFEEDDYVLADVSYQTVEERFIYLPKRNFDSIGNIPVVTNLTYYDGVTTANVTPSWGPDNRFHAVSVLAVNKGTSVKVYFQENGFVYAEYASGKGTARMWLPADQVEITGATVTYSTTPITPAGQSSYK